MHANQRITGASSLTLICVAGFAQIPGAQHELALTPRRMYKYAERNSGRNRCVRKFWSLQLCWHWSVVVRPRAVPTCKYLNMYSTSGRARMVLKRRREAFAAIYG